MATDTSNLNHTQVTALAPPAVVRQALPCSNEAAALVAHSRTELRRIVHGQDPRLAVIVGPCSIHDRRAALEYARRLAPLRVQLADQLEIVMRVYFEKPRTTTGWKGLINDPDLNGTFDVGRGMRVARTLLRDINALGVPCGCEFLDPATPPYLADLVAWGAVGARTTESQTHREMASGLPCPVGFKNATSGSVGVAIDAMVAAAAPHTCIGLTDDGGAAVVRTAGNPDGHVILRGGVAPNYDAQSVAAACAALAEAQLPARVIVDVSHANSGKQAERQPDVVADVCGQLEAGSRAICGVMLESHLRGGRQDIGAPALRYGQSVTDACLDWDTTRNCLLRLAQAVRRRVIAVAA